MHEAFINTAHRSTTSGLVTHFTDMISDEKLDTPNSR
jgi:hypothetical protein